VGALLNFYDNETSERKAVYANINLTVPLSNPVVADAAGAFPSIFADTDEVYSVTCFSPLGVMLPQAAYSFVRAGVVQSTATAEVDLRDYGAIFDGRNNAVPIVQAEAALVALGGGILRFPPGEANINGGAIVKNSQCAWVGAGKNRTLINKTDNLGPMIVSGNESGDQSSHMSGMGLFHSYTGMGPGFSLPVLAADVVYPMTTGAILDFPNGPYRGLFSDLWLVGGQQQIRIRGGAQSQFYGCDTSGMWDPAVPALQLSESGIRVDPGPHNEFATNIDIIACTMGGTITQPTSPGVYPMITWPGGFTSTDTAANIGPKNILDIRACESFHVIGGYIGSAANFGIRFRPTIHPVTGFFSLSGFSLEGTFLDAAQVALVGIDNPDGGELYNAAIRPSDSVLQTNGWTAFYDGDPANTGITGINITWDGPIRACVGPGIFAVRTRGFVHTGGGITGYNAKGFYTADAYTTGRNSAIWFGANVVKCQANGIVGGNGAYGADVKTVYGVSTSSPTQVGTVGLMDGGCATALRAGFPAPTTTRNDTSNFGITPRVDSLSFDHIGTLTSSITGTFSTTGADFLAAEMYPNPLRAKIVRNSTGAFNLNIAGVTTKALTAVGQFVEFTYYPGAGWRQSDYGTL
jgi:hypothetical protein